MEVKLYPVAQPGPDRFPSSLFLQSKRSLFRNYIKYRVMVAQEKYEDGDILFQLWKGHDPDQAKECFEKIQVTLSPLLYRGMVQLTKPFLKELLVPEPLHPKDIASHLIDVMDRNPDAHPEWLGVIQALLDKSEPPPMDSESRKEYIASLKAKYAIGSNKRSIRMGASLMMRSVPLIAVPEAADMSEDDRESDQVWKFFKRGGSRSFLKVGNWLINAVKKEQPKSCVNLILSGVGTSFRCQPSLDTALHIVTRKSDVMLVKLLLAYRADPSIPNAANETPLDIAKALKTKNSNEIVALMEEMAQLHSVAHSYYSQNTEVPEKRNSSDVFLLSLDGGGMKAVVECHILAAINARMNELCNSCKPFQSYFDYIAGTSAGAIIAAMLLYQSTVTVTNAGMYLYRFMNEVFGSSKMDRSDKLKEFVTEAVGENTVLADIPKGNIIVTTTIANISPSKLHLMTNYGGSRDGFEGPAERKVWEALVASSAAPTYFPAYQCFLDGGLMANNPTLAAMADIFRHENENSKPAKTGFVLSVGSGYLRSPKKVDNFEVYVPGFTLGIMGTLLNSSLGLMSLLNHFVEQSTQSDGQVTREAKCWCESIGARYDRLSPPLVEDVAPDMKSLQELVDVLYETEMYVLSEYKRIDRIAKTILSK